jgi:hypothetical protein
MVGILPTTPHPALMRRHAFTGPQMLAASRAELIEAIYQTPREQRDELFRDALIEHGGTLVEPDPRHGWGPLEIEVSLLGIFASGGTPEAAVNAWAKAASRSLRDPGGLAA